jgi:hypothetical protein
MNFPQLIDSRVKTEGVVLAVFAPFGGDEVLSSFPDGLTTSVQTHPLVDALKSVAAAGIHVVALLDRVEDNSWLIEIPAGQPAAMQLSSRWKHDMTSERTLAGLLAQAHERCPRAAVVLSIEGHGAGYLPDVNRSQLTWKKVTDGGKFEWHFGDRDCAPVHSDGSPVLPMGFPGLPMGFPGLPVNRAYMSTHQLGQALELAQKLGAPRPAVIHFNNCFNMSVEVLDTVAPYADYATGYCNYNFFTSGASYPKVFGRLRDAGGATAQQLATWFAEENHNALLSKPRHPTVAGVIALSRMEGIREGVDRLSDALLQALQGASLADRPAVVAMIRQAIFDAQQYDSEPGWDLETPDQLTDLCSLAATLSTHAVGYPPIQQAAAELAKLLSGIKAYGDNDVPWLDDTDKIRWDFRTEALAMNIFLPDPLLDGVWDWRSTYYVDVNPDTDVQRGVIEFLTNTTWVDFLVEYHKDVPFKAFHVGSIPQLPAFNRESRPVEPPKDDGGPDSNGGHCGTPRKPWPLGAIGLRLLAWLGRHGDRA